MTLDEGTGTLCYGKGRMPGVAQRRASLEQIELHMWTSRGELAIDLAAARSSPRREIGAPLLDLGLLVRENGAATARAVRVGSTAPLDVLVRSEVLTGSIGSPAQAALHLVLQPIYRDPGRRPRLLLARARGEVEAIGQRYTVDDALLLWSERFGSRRPYAWARAVLRGELGGLPLLCLVETARSRAGSVVLPELGRLRLLGPGARELPAACQLTPLPLRAEYGTGRLRAAALAPGVKIAIELEAPPATTGLFEVVDPSGEAAYAHRALGATAGLRITTRRGGRIAIPLEGRYEWGARAGDPRVALRAWRA
jgi:hypothetical protein